MRYATARFNQHQRDLAYRIYVTDCLRIATENTARFNGGSYKTVSFEEIIRNKKEKELKPGEAKASICKKLRKEEQIESI